LAKFGHLYIWFVIIVAGLAGLPRLLLSRRFAELQQAKLRQKNSAARSRLMSLVVFLIVLVFTAMYFTRWKHEAWIAIAIVFSLLSSAEFFFQAQFPELESLVFQNRLLGILYLGLSAASYVMLSRV
jgi:hypothetical protein